MGDQSKITWTDATWNPVTGCSPVSPGCDNCYARRMSKRLAGRAGYPADEPFRVTVHCNRFDQPLRWTRPRVIFVCSMGDLFHEEVATQTIFSVLDICQQASRQHGHLFQLLTKRAARMKQVVGRWKVRARISEMPSGMWFGVTAENQETAEERIPLLLETPAVKRFISYEPALGPIDPTHIRLRNDPLDGDENPAILNAFTACVHHPRTVKFAPGVLAEPGGIDWVIAGGESGPRARPAHPDWFRELREHCVEAKVPFHFKQYGEWTQASDENGIQGHVMPDTGEKYTWIGWDGKTQNPSWHGLEDPILAVARVGKKAAGRELDGRIWDEMPEIVPS